MFYPLENGAALCFHGYASLLPHQIGGRWRRLVHCDRFSVVHFLVQNVESAHTLSTYLW